jgi:hypothetical protein
MKYILFFAAIIFQQTIGNTQSLKLPVGKKFTVNSITSNLAEVTMMDNHMQMQNDGNLQLLYEINTITNTGYTLQVTPLHMNFVITMNGIEQKLDTDNPADKENPLFAQLMSLINHPQTIEVENNKVIKNSQISPLNQTGMQDDNSKLFLTVPNTNLHIGFLWTDSTVTETTKFVNRNTVMQLTDTTVAIHVISDFSLHNTAEQGGIKMEQNLKGFSNADRTYNKLNGLLKEERLDMDISGSTESQQMTSPITMKMKIKMKVEDK